MKILRYLVNKSHENTVIWCLMNCGFYLKSKLLTSCHKSGIGQLEYKSYKYTVIGCLINFGYFKSVLLTSCGNEECNSFKTFKE